MIFLQLNYSDNKPKIDGWKVINQDGKDIKFITEDSLINTIKREDKLIPLKLELSETINIDDSWGSLSLFEKYKKITYITNCSYSIDLTLLTKSDLSINKKTNSVSIKIPKPEIEHISIDNDKTLYEETVTGLLRFGDINLTPEEYGLIKGKIIKDLSYKMLEEELYTQACHNAKDSVESLLKSILGENIKTKIEFLS